MAQEFTRQQLYELAWSQPLTKLAAHLKLSPPALKKAFRRADIPVPEHGHWARIQAGKAVVPRPLPPRGIGMSDTVTVGTVQYNSNYAELKERLRTEQIPEPPPFPESIGDIRERVKTVVGAVPVPTTLVKTHGVVARLLEEDDRRRQNQRAYPSAWNVPLFDSAPERRRLRVLNALLLALQRCGYVASRHDDPARRDERVRELVVQIGDRKVYFAVEPVPDRSHASRKTSTPDAKAAGTRLRFTVHPYDDASGTPRVWEDKDDTLIETHATEMVVEVIVSGEINYRISVQRAYEWRLERKTELEAEARREAQEQERKRRERQAALEKKHLDHLFSEAANWRRAGDVRGFVEAVRAAKQSDDPDLIAQLDRWATWALAQADRLDPLAQGGPTFPEEEREQAT